MMNKELELANKKLELVNKELESANKELKQFIYIASHDLQEPLRTIHGYVDLLNNRYKDKLDSDAKDFMGYITIGADRMQQMIDSLLLFSRIMTRKEEFTSTNIEKVLDITLENLRLLIDTNNAIITYDPMPIIIADELQMTQLFQNLIENAIKFKKKGIAPEIHISAIKRNNNIDNNMYNNIYNEEWLFSVKDNGIGIDKTQFKKLFIVFQRLHNREEYPGTGIGLSICKKIVERHKGNIWIESDVNIGSTFFFTIPEGKYDE